jgi:two-component system chemotaxis sensor kinase CheA
MSIDMTQFHGVFFDESQEHLENMEQELMDLNLDNPDAEQLNSIFRAAHSIKGGSGIFGFDALTGLTHIMENLLDKARQGQVQLTTDIVNVLLQTVDILKLTLDAYRHHQEVDQHKIEQGIHVLERALLEHETQEETVSDVVPVDEGFGFFDTEEDLSVTLEDDGFGLFEPLEPALTTRAQTAEDEGFGFFTDDSSAPQVEEQAYGFFEPFEPPTKAKELNTPTKKAPGLSPSAKITDNKTQAPKINTESGSIRVDTSKIDSLVNLVGELVITQSMLAMIGNEVAGSIEEKLQTALAELQRNTREIQESVMSMRMLPMSVTFNRFPRVVRDLSTKLGKKVDLRIEGGNTEIDKGMIEKLVDPLTHLVRNSIDHGIEKTADRIAMGKPEEGIVILRAEQKGSTIQISIVDDGAGLNRERILAKAAENGLDVDPNMPDAQVWNLIFEAGFSTAAEVTDVSGRGVGMDVVRRNIEAIGGRIEIESTAGEGSGFYIQLPLTLAIVDGMCVGVGEQIFVIPLLNIVESIQPSKEQVKTISNDNLLWIRDKYWPLIHLHKNMQIDNAIHEPDKGIVVLLESNKKRFGLLVDSLVGQQQVVIKSLEKHYKRVTGVAGATIMGDGGVAMILDVESLADSVTQTSTGGN